jgi:hypothetical protein
MAAVRKETVKKGKRSRLFSGKEREDAIAGWKQDLIRILQIFNVCLVAPAQRSLSVFFLDGAVDE